MTAPWTPERVIQAEYLDVNHHPQVRTVTGREVGDEFALFVADVPSRTAWVTFTANPMVALPARSGVSYEITGFGGFIKNSIGNIGTGITFTGYLEEEPGTLTNLFRALNQEDNNSTLNFYAPVTFVTAQNTAVSVTYAGTPFDVGAFVNYIETIRK